MIVWAQRKLNPKKEIRPDQMVQCDYFFSEKSRLKFHCVEDPSDPLGLNDLWSSLHLVWGRLVDFMALVAVNSLKEPQRSVPKKMWRGVSTEVGLFSIRLQEVILALLGTQDPSFRDLLKVFCGGSLSHKCSFCHVNVTVAAIAREVEGNGGNVPSVLLHPYFPVLFSCKATKCFKQLESQDLIWIKWHVAVKATFNKLRMKECNFCFKLTEDVHRLSSHNLFLFLMFHICTRCNRCYTKNWCSKECLAQDWEEKHKKFCHQKADKRKVKSGSELRRANEMEALEETFAGMEAAENSGIKEELGAVKKMCQKKKSKTKAGSSKHSDAL